MSRKKLVDEVEVKTQMITNLLADVRVNLETLGEQKSLVDHLVGEAGAPRLHDAGSAEHAEVAAARARAGRAHRARHQTAAVAQRCRAKAARSRRPSCVRGGMGASGRPWRPATASRRRRSTATVGIRRRDRVGENPRFSNTARSLRAGACRFRASASSRRATRASLFKGLQHAPRDATSPHDRATRTFA